MLHAAHHFLTDEAALGERHAVEQIDVGLVREGVAEDVVLAALGHAEGDAVGVIVLRIAVRTVKSAFRKHAQTQFRQAWIGKDDGTLRPAGAVGAACPHTAMTLYPALASLMSTFARSLYMVRRLTRPAAWSLAVSSTNPSPLLATKNSNRILPWGVSSAV